VLLVSHNMAAVQNLCPRSIWLDEGRVARIGPSDQVVAEYLQSSASGVTCQEWDDVRTAPGNESVRLRRVAVVPEKAGAPLTMATAATLEFEYWNLVPDAYLNLSVAVENEYGITVFNTTSVFDPEYGGKSFPAGLFRSVCQIPGKLLNEGLYRVHLYVVKDAGVVLHSFDEVLVFEVEDAAELRAQYFGRWSGVVHPELDWRTELVVPGVPESPVE
jgi:lipopolysaccharide transport system ATP-binding protein